MKKIVFFNLRTGVAQTTDAKNLVSGLARIERKLNPLNPKKVLFISMDQRGDGTQIIGGAFNNSHKNMNQPTETIADFLKGEGHQSVKQICKRARFRNDINKKSCPENLYYITHSPYKMTILNAFTPISEINPNALEIVLQSISHIYEYVIIDCEPFYRPLSVMSLNAATHVIIPTIPVGCNFRPLKMAISEVNKYRSQNNKELDLLGIVPSQCMINRTEHVLVLKELYKEYSNLLLPSIHEHADISFAFSCGMDIFSFCPPRNNSGSIFSERKEAQEFGFFSMEVYRRLNSYSLIQI